MTFWSCEIRSSAFVTLLSDSREAFVSDNFEEWHWPASPPSNETHTDISAKPGLSFAKFSSNLKGIHPKTFVKHRSWFADALIFLPGGVGYTMDGDGSAKINPLGENGRSSGLSIFNVKFFVSSWFNLNLTGIISSDYSDTSYFGTSITPIPGVKTQIRLLGNNGATIYEAKAQPEPMPEPVDGILNCYPCEYTPSTKIIDFDGTLSSGIYTLIVEGLSKTHADRGGYSQAAFEWDFTASLSSAPAPIPIPATLPLSGFTLVVLGLMGRRNSSLRVYFKNTSAMPRLT